MSRPQVTITLGRSGQKVVKRSSASQGNRFGQQTLSRGKRSTDFEDPSLSLRKRVRGDKDAGVSRYGRGNAARVGQNDLRLKLMQRRRQREILRQIEERRKEQHNRMTGSVQEQCKRMARIVQSAEQSHRRLVTSSQLSSGASELLHIEAIRSSYASQTAGGVSPRSPNRLVKDSREVTSSRNISAAQHVPSVRPAEASRMVRMMGNDLVDPSQDQPSVTVTSLLNSLSLGKYAIHFQAEEVDMAALKQMGDRDLKDLGIPMGPRKKILQAMLSRTRRAV